MPGRGGGGGLSTGCGTQARAGAAETSLAGKMDLFLELFIAPAAAALGGLVSPGDG